jgi:predicted transcriptional regulator
MMNDEELKPRLAELARNRKRLSDAMARARIATMVSEAARSTALLTLMQLGRESEERLKKSQALLSGDNSVEQENQIER